MSGTAAPSPSRAWIVWASPAALFLIAYFHRAATGVVAKDLMHAFHASGALLGLLSATYFWGYAAFMVPGGVLLDAYGPRRVVACGGAVMGLGSLAMAVASSESLLFGGRLLVGLGAAVTFVGALKISASWFPPAQFGMMSAITATMGMLGSLVATVPLAAAVSLAGWRGAFVLVSVVTLAGAAACWLIVRDAPGAPRRGAAAVGLRDVLRGMGSVLMNRHTWPPFLAFFCAYSAVADLLLWTVPYLRDVYGLGTARAAAYATATSVALVVAAPLTGWLSDRVFRRRKAPYVVLNGAFFLVWVAFAVTAGRLPLWGVYALFFAMGLFGASFVLTWPIGREVNPPDLAGVSVAVVNLGGFLGVAVTQAPLGAMLDARWAGAMVEGARAYSVDAYRATFFVCAVLVLLSLVVALLVRETGGRNVWAELTAAAAEPVRPRA